MVIGVTGEEGIELSLICSPDGLNREGKPFDEPDGDWALLRNYHRDTPPLEFMPRRMAAYLIDQSYFNLGSHGYVPSLDHNHFRFAQKAGVTVFEGHESQYDFDRTRHGYRTVEEAEEEHKQFDKNFDLIRSMSRFPGPTSYIPKTTLGILRLSAYKPTHKVRITSNGIQASVEPIL